MIPKEADDSSENSKTTGSHAKVPSKNDYVSPTFDEIGARVPVCPVPRDPTSSNSTASPHVVVVLRPNTAGPALVPWPSTQLETATSPELRFVENRAEETAQDERFCVRIWALCAAVTFPVVFSMWLMLVPYLVRTSQTVFPVARPASATPPLPPPSSSPLTTTQTSPAATTDVWSGVPPTCLKPPVSPTLPASFQVGPSYNSTLPAPSTRPFFCAYDNRHIVLSDTTWNFMFETLPFALCPNVVYWSVGVVDGSLTSRVPSFDQQHGLHQLRNITDRLGYPNIRILLALGGYGEDAPHFSRLGRDDATMQRLMRSVTDGMRDYRLNGVTVDWQLPASGCGGSDDKAVLAALMFRLRQYLNQHGMNHTILSLVLGADSGYETVADRVAGVVNYFFIAKDLTTLPGPTNSPDFCSGITNVVHAAVANYVQNMQRVSLDQLCIAEDLTPLATILNVSSATGSIATLPDLYGPPFYTLCNAPSFCRNDNVSGSCVSHFLYADPPGQPHRLAAYVATSNVTTLQARADLSGIHGPSSSPASGQGCVLAFNMHADNFASECGPPYRQYLLTEHLYYGTIGQNAPSASILDAAPQC
ncbi:uncharacterized protein LOC144103732 [Amblyomma americanum]|uniref:GH18 domain-containing protein n=1 Tax=Amblyomma americanum TaxID=6943 RepID=A0AAQ4D6V4_AMBAM